MIKQLNTLRGVAHWVNKTSILSLLLIVLLAITVKPAYGRGGQGGQVSDFGQVLARTLVKGESGAPIYAEFDTTGTVVNVIHEAVGAYADARVMAGEQYLANVDQFEQFEAQNPQQESGWVILTRNEYLQSQFSSPQGAPVSKPPLHSLTQSVVVHGPARRHPAVPLTLLTSQIDLDNRQSFGTNIKSVLLDSAGRVLKTSPHNIGFRSAWFKHDDPSLDNSGRRSDEPIGGVPNIKVWTTMDGFSNRNASTDEEGKYHLNYRVPRCPGFSYFWDYHIVAEIPYKGFNPRGAFRGTYSAFQPQNYVCSDVAALLKNSTSLVGQAAALEVAAIEAGLNGTGIFKTYFRINMIMVAGRGVLANPDGTAVPVDTSTTYNDQGLLETISSDDLGDTDLFVFRESNGQLITSREGLKDEEHVYYDGVGQGQGGLPENEFFYRLPMRGPAIDTVNFSGRTSFSEYQSKTNMNPALHQSRADHLRVGEQIRIVAVNRPTGYIGTLRTTLASASDDGAGGQGNSRVDFDIEQLVLQPPNLKVRAERTFEQVTSSASEDKTNLIGSEGAALDSDQRIVISTEWYDQDGSPLPEELDGYTGRLAKIVANKVVADANSQVGHFAIQPGRHTEVIHLNGSANNANHYYVQVSGEAMQGGSPNFASGSHQGVLSGRPKTFVPVQVPFFNKEATTASELSRLAQLINDYQTGAAPVLDDPEPVYDWVYRPEMHFTIYDLDIEEAYLESVYDEEQGTVLSANLTYDLGSTQLESLGRLNGDAQLVWSLGLAQVLADISGQLVSEELGANQGGAIDANSQANLLPGLQVKTVKDILSKLQPEDFVALQLFQADDAANGLYSFTELPVMLATPRAVKLNRRVQVASYDTGIGNAGTDEITDSHQRLTFTLTEPADVSLVLVDGNDRDNVLATLLSQDNLPPGKHNAVVTYEDVASRTTHRVGPDFYLLLKAVSSRNNDTLETRYFYPGERELTVEGQQLGNILQHEVLIQRGELSLRREDISLKGLGPQLNFIRSYTNRSTLRASKDSVMGPGWSHNHDITLSAIAYGDAGLSAARNLPAWVVDNKNTFFRDSAIEKNLFPRLLAVSNGGVFKRVGSTWYPQRGHHGSLTFNNDGVEYVSKDGTRYLFDYPYTPEDEPFTLRDNPSHASLGDLLYQRLGLGFNAQVTALNNACLPADATVCRNVQEQGEAGRPRPVKSIIDRNGNELTYSYRFLADGQEVVDKITDAVGRHMNFTYQYIGGEGQFKYHRLTDVRVELPGAVDAGSTDPVDLTFDYEPGSNDNPVLLLSQFSRDEFTERYDYQEEETQPVYPRAFNLKELTDANGHRTTYDYHAVSAVEDDVALSIKQLSKADLIKSVEYEDSANANPSAQFAYSVAGGKATRTLVDLRGFTTTYTLNAWGNPIEINEPEGKRTTMKWSLEEAKPDNLMWERNEVHTGLVVTYDYDAQGNVISETDNQTNQSITQTWRQDFSLLEHREDRNGNVVNYEYDANGNLKKQTTRAATVHDGANAQVADISVTHNYRSNGLRDSTIDGRNNSTSYDYDAMGNLKTLSEPEGSVTRYSNDARGRRIGMTDPNGNEYSYQFDTLDRLILSTDPLGNTVANSYDPKGNKKQETQRERYRSDATSTPNQSTELVLNYDYDERDRVSQVNRSGSGLLRARNGNAVNSAIAGVMSYQYDAGSNVTRETDWKGQATTHTYDGINRRLVTSNRVNDDMSYDYTFISSGGDAGTTTGMTDYRGDRVVTVNDRLGRKLSVTYPDVTLPIAGGSQSASISYAYDNENNVLKVTDAEGRETDYDYDSRYLVIKTTNAFDDDAVMGFDANGNEVFSADVNNQVTRKTFDKQNRVTQVAQEEGHTTSYAYDDNSNVISKTDPWGFAYSTTFDALNHTLTYTDPDGTATQAHTKSGNLTYSKDSNGHERTMLFDALNREVSSEDPRGRQNVYVYDQNSNRTQELFGWTSGAAYGPVLVRNNKIYDALDRVDAEIKAQGAAAPNTTLFIDYAYDADSNLTSITYPPHADGPKVVSYQYDQRDRRIIETDESGFTTKTDYDKVGNARFVENRRGFLAETIYDDLNRPKETRSPNLAAKGGLPIVTAQSYDAVGNVLTETDGRGTITTHTYDKLNRLLTSIKPDGDHDVRIVKNDWDKDKAGATHLGAARHVNTLQDANDNVIQSDLNFRGQPTVRLNADNTQVSNVYDPAGNLLEAHDERNFVTRTTYFEDDTPKTLTNAENEITHFEYDLFGNVAKTTKPKGDAYAYTQRFDERNRLIKVKDADGNITRYAYDVYGNLTDHFYPSATDSSVESHVQYEYDRRDLKVKHLQPYEAGTLTSVISYDPNQNRKGLTDANGQVFSYQYDEIDRLIQTDYPKVQNDYLAIQFETMAYDDNSNVVNISQHKLDSSATPSTDVCTRSYDLLDRMLTDSQRGHVLTLGYDDVGNRTNVQTQHSTTSYTYDAKNRLDTAVVDAQTTDYVYFDNNWTQQITYPNGTETVYTYDQVQRPLSITNRKTADQALISSYSYQYDDNGNRTQQVENQTGFATQQQATTTYNYDILDRLESHTLTQSNGDIAQTQYSYYPSYDRKTEVVTETPIATGIAAETENRSYTYNQLHWLKQIEDNSDGDTIDYTFDNNGNSLTKLDNTGASPVNTVFSYDSKNQLVKLAQGPPAAETNQGRFDYNYAGMRIRHRDSSRGDIEYIYDQSAIIDEVQLGTSTLVAHYNYADRLLSLNDGASKQYYHYQSLRSTANLTDSTGATKTSYRIDPFGEITQQEGNTLNRQVFTGQEHDENTGLIYFGARFYDPDTARFINQDSYLGEQGTPPSLHRYLYAYSNPTRWIDIFGHCPGAPEGQVSMCAIEGSFWGGLWVFAKQAVSGDTFARDPSEPASSAVLPILGGVDTRRSPQEDADYMAAMDNPIVKTAAIISGIRTGKAIVKEGPEALKSLTSKRKSQEPDAPFSSKKENEQASLTGESDSGSVNGGNRTDNGPVGEGGESVAQTSETSKLPDGYHARTVNDKTVVARNPGKQNLPKLSQTDEGDLYSPVKFDTGHGNTAGNQPAECYALLCRRTGDVKKYGETTHGEDAYGTGSQRRYTKKELKEMDVEYEKLGSGTKKEMKELQTEKIKQFEKENGVKPELNKTYQ